MSIAVGRIVDALGGKRAIPRAVKSDADLAAAVAVGLPGRTLRFVRQALGLTTKEFGEAILIPERTLLTYQKRTTLPVAESDRLFRLAQVSAAATEAFGDREKATRWLRKPNRSLGGKSPLESVRTSIGQRLVEDALGRIMYGTIG